MILITRPPDDAKEMAETLRQKGYESVIAPMLEIEYHNYRPEKYASYITTSKHARKFVPQNAKLISIPEQGENAAAVYKWILTNLNPKIGEIIYLRGKDISFDITLKLHSAGYNCDEAIVYEAKPAKTLTADLNSIKLATFLSTQTLKNFIKLTDERNIPLLVLSQKIAAIAKANGFQQIQVAPKPTLDSLLNTIYNQDFSAITSPC